MVLSEIAMAHLKPCFQCLIHNTWDHSASAFLPLITLTCSGMVVSRNLSLPGWHCIPADGCNYICSFWTWFLTMLRWYLFKSDILILWEESILALQLAARCVQGISSAGWGGDGVFCQSWHRSESVCSSGETQLPGSWATHTALDLPRGCHLWCKTFIILTGLNSGCVL